MDLQLTPYQRLVAFALSIILEWILKPYLYSSDSEIAVRKQAYHHRIMDMLWQAAKHGVCKGNIYEKMDGRSNTDITGS